MQDTKNLKRKLIEYRKILLIQVLQKDKHRIEYWESEIKWIEDRINSRKTNRKKNLKQFKKANGYFPK
jgi:hypothetical protein